MSDAEPPPQESRAVDGHQLYLMTMQTAARAAYLLSQVRIGDVYDHAGAAGHCDECKARGLELIDSDLALLRAYEPIIEWARRQRGVDVPELHCAAPPP